MIILFQLIPNEYQSVLANFVKALTEISWS
jgi:hypothetical protein